MTTRLSYSSCLDDYGIVTDLSNDSEARLGPASAHRPMESIVLLPKQLVATLEHLSAIQTQQDSLNQSRNQGKNATNSNYNFSHHETAPTMPRPTNETRY